MLQKMYERVLEIPHVARWTNCRLLSAPPRPWGKDFPSGMGKQQLARAVNGK
jgi:hypothetical protein